ncbi:MAG: Fe(2+)-trafficking protein [Gemmataceae bacterium]|nr:Fe(2+)-trafficking protein [Gemmataceae bacterium]
MSQLQERIEQFRKMANDDPDNELGHFRLGQLLMENGQLEDAVKSFQRTLVLSPQFAKVFQLLGQCLIQLNRREEAVKLLTEGYVVADEHGHNMPRDEMGKMLVSLGAKAPESKKATSAAGATGDGFHCQRPGCIAGSHAHKLPKPPMNDDLGRRVCDSICADCWNDWLRNYSVKVINELRLDLSREDHQGQYDEYMRGFFGLE